MKGKKFSDERIANIRALFAGGMSANEIARRLKTTTPSISKYCAGIDHPLGDSSQRRFILTRLKASGDYWRRYGISSAFIDEEV